MMTISKINCRRCRELRWNDGLRCPRCGVYENRFLADDGRGGVIDSRRRSPVVAEPPHAVKRVADDR